MNRLTIPTFSCLTNDFIMNIDDTLFKKTMASRAFNDKFTFVNKIIDKTVRFQMLQPIVLLQQTPVIGGTVLILRPHNNERDLWTTLMYIFMVFCSVIFSIFILVWVTWLLVY
jgi:hypothetical protein